MILFLDNYDSFTYNLYQYIGELYPDIQVVRNDEITLEEIEAMHPDALLISPGPGYPKDAGISIPAIQKFAGKMPILGICLGHQLLALCTRQLVSIQKLQPLPDESADLPAGNPSGKSGKPCFLQNRCHPSA